MRTLYLGLEVPPDLQKESVVHCPFIRIVPKSSTDPMVIQAFQAFHNYTHVIFTSKSAVALFFDHARSFHIKKDDISNKMIIAVGRRTAEKLSHYHIEANLIAETETAEGIIEALVRYDLKNSHFFLPQSAIARPTLCEWLTKQKIKHTACPIYDTLSNFPVCLPDLAQFDQIILTSPSIVDAFAQAYKGFSDKDKLVCIGPITRKRLHELFSFKEHLSC